MYLRNVGNIARIHTVSSPETESNSIIDHNENLKSIIVYEVYNSYARERVNKCLVDICRVIIPTVVSEAWAVYSTTTASNV
jgi:hypothetical protein